MNAPYWLEKQVRDLPRRDPVVVAVAAGCAVVGVCTVTLLALVGWLAVLIGAVIVELILVLVLLSLYDYDVSDRMVRSYNAGLEKGSDTTERLTAERNSAVAAMNAAKGHAERQEWRAKDALRTAERVKRAADATLAKADAKRREARLYRNAAKAYLREAARLAPLSPPPAPPE